MKNFFLAFALFFAGSAQAFQVSGVAFTDWYFPPGKYKYTMGFTIGGLVLEKGDVGGKEQVACWGDGCTLRIEGNTDFGYYLKSLALTPVTGTPVDYPLEEFNKLLRQKLPWSGSMDFFRNGIGDPFCMKLSLSTGLRTLLLGSSCDGTLPPIKPPPSVPIACQVKGLSRETIDFGTIIQGSEHRAKISASLGCEGDPSQTGQARLLFTDAERRGGDAAILRNARGEEIKARLSVGSEGGGNQSYLQVKAGYQTTYPLFVQLKAADFAGRSGYFSGTALLIFEVL